MGDYTKPNYQDHRWPEEIEKVLRVWGETASPRLFYVAEDGDIQENDRLVQAIAYLKNGYSLQQDFVDRILAKSIPVLQLKAVKVERMEYDLFKTALDRGQKSLVEQLLPYIDINDYAPEVQKKVEELLKE